MGDFFDDFDRITREFFDDFGPYRSYRVDKSTISPDADVFEDNKKVYVIVEMVGVKKENIEINIDEDRVTIKAIIGEEKRFFKRVMLPSFVEKKEERMIFNNGILELILKKKEKQPKKEKGSGIRIRWKT